jgi:two-component system NtrC family sensor kinase
MRCHEALECPEVDQLGGTNGCAACEVLMLKESRRLLRALPDEAGVLHRWEVTLNPVVDPSGKVTHVVEVWRDITVRSQLESQLSHNERLASLGMLAAGVAHEINNPLTGVLTFAHLLLRDAPEGSTEKEDLQTIVDSTVRCKDIVQGLLNFSRQNEPHKALANLNDVLRKALNLTKNQARIRQTSVVEEMDDGLPQLVIDPNQIQEVAVNVIVNALDAMPEGGRLAVRTRRVREDRSDWAEFEISDTGCGIPEENLEHIFDPFFTTKRSGEGTGLGLAVSYGIVMEHGGQMNASSTVGQGTTMTVRLPIASKD